MTSPGPHDPSAAEATERRRLAFYLDALRELGGALAVETRHADTPAALRDSLQRIMGTFAAGRGAILLWDPSTRQLAPAAARGLRAFQSTAPIDLSAARARVLALARPFKPAMPHGGVEKLAARLREPMERAGLDWAVPISAGDTLTGMLLLGPSINGRALDEQQLEVLAEMARMVGLRIEDARVRRRLASQVRQLQTAGRELRKIYLETLRALAAVIDGPDADGRPTHSQRVAALAAETGRRLGLPPETCERLYVAGLLHDIGKQVISRELLDKPDALAPPERNAVQSHPATGSDLIAHLRFPWGDVAEIIRHHHERPDGGGYPDRLHSGQISIEARVLMMAEGFDAMTSDQPWRPRLAFEQVIEQISHNLGLQFDPAVAAALCEAVREGLDGRAVEADFVPHLESGFDGEVVRRLLGELRRQIENPSLLPKAPINPIADEPA